MVIQNSWLRTIRVTKPASPGSNVCSLLADGLEAEDVAITLSSPADGAIAWASRGANGVERARTYGVRTALHRSRPWGRMMFARPPACFCRDNYYTKTTNMCFTPCKPAT